MSTDTSEKGLELLIVRALTGLTGDEILKPAPPGVREALGAYKGTLSAWQHAGL